MSVIFLRRRKLGRTSTREIASAVSALLPNVECKVIRNWKPEYDAPPSPVDWLVRWGCTSDYGVPAERTLNTSESIHWCSDKRQGRLDMQAAGVPVPRSFDPREIFASFEDGHEGDFYVAAEEAGLDKEYVLRPAAHAQGRNILYGTLAEISDNLDSLYHGARRLYDLFLDGYLSYKIDKVAEYRVFVCQNRAVWVTKKTPGNPDDVAWNVAQGGRFDNVRWDDWNTKVIDAALKAAKISGTDFCGVDVMVDGDGYPYVLEVNSAPSQTSPYRQSCVGKVIACIVRSGSKQPMPDIEWNARRTYKSYIHPAVRQEDGGVSSTSST